MWQPYQPLVLRIIHGLTAVFTILALLTAYWTYDVYDGRWGQIPLPKFDEIEGIHGTFGLWTLLIFPLLVFYAFHRGQKRLIQTNSWEKITKINQKGWWYHLHRLVNTIILFSLTFAVFTGKMMDEKWLPNGELNHGWYYGHLIAWLMLIISLAFHLLMSAKVGGLPFLLSIINWSYKSQDSPSKWKSQIKAYWSNFRLSLFKDWWISSSWIKWLELIIWISLGAAWIISLIKEIE
ncbi:cytochrome b/b6 domain-containing protein [Crocosphaera sp. UHCC 0190]|uniref:cytochrome b/b6 domain-containing protein n=1 Tax=Crocosphaera sp. UHCC 0190 TaxID=3110246 RepID=UPI002B21AD53|nr:cytochrome b/b6 domain-containing protein [Crocosphaera sp. UHCC 0190]MEA5508821.1 cytochrome b/b6 domain-containing protein [Crocosphaera sp. UHCC 0190]